MAKERNTERRSAICPLCGKTYTEYPALSREDNETLICPDCGIRQALDSIGVKPIEQNEILGIIHRHSANRGSGTV